MRLDDVADDTTLVQDPDGETVPVEDWPEGRLVREARRARLIAVADDRERVPGEVGKAIRHLRAIAKGMVRPLAVGASDDYELQRLRQDLLMEQGWRLYAGAVEYDGERVVVVAASPALIDTVQVRLSA